MTCLLISAIVREPKSHSLFCFHYDYIAPYDVFKVIVIFVRTIYFMLFDKKKTAVLGDRNIRFRSS